VLNQETKSKLVPANPKASQRIPLKLKLKLCLVPSPTSNPLIIKLNLLVYVLVKTICRASYSTSEAKTSGIFLAAQEAVPILCIPTELGYPQASLGTPIETDNSTAHDIMTYQFRLKCYKAFDMWYHLTQPSE